MRKPRRIARLKRAIDFARTIEELWRRKRLRWESELFALERPVERVVKGESLAERLRR